MFFKLVKRLPFRKLSFPKLLSERKSPEVYTPQQEALFPDKTGEVLKEIEKGRRGIDDKILDDLVSKISEDPDKKQIYQRPSRQEPGKVIWGFIPLEWSRAFENKTGKTGLHTFVFTSGCFLLSKEILILEHNFYNGLSMALLTYLAIKKVGPSMAQYLDQEIDKYENDWNTERTNLEVFYKEEILEEKKLQEQFEGQLMVIAAKRENVALQLEADFRKRQMEAYNRTVKLLEYQLLVQEVQKKYQLKNMVLWVTSEVQKAISDDLDRKLISFSIDFLQKEAARVLMEEKSKITAKN